MLIEERQSRLQELIARQGMSDLDSLAAALDVSQSTIRRDIEIMAQKGLVRRTHGGVIWLGDRVNTSNAYAFEDRLGANISAKRSIARAAANLVQPGQTILIDGGTTPYYLAESLIGQTLQLVTNSLPIAQLFLNDEKVELILTGGLLYPRYGVFLGPGTEAMLATIHAQQVFLSAAGILDGVMYNQNLLLVHTERKMMEQAQRVVLLVDHAKFGNKSLVRLGELSEIDTVVCDVGLDEASRKAVLDAGCELILAE